MSNDENSLKDYLQKYVNNSCKNLTKKQCNSHTNCSWFSADGCYQKDKSQDEITSKRLFGKKIQYDMNEILEGKPRKNIKNPELDKLFSDIENSLELSINNKLLEKECSFNGDKSLFTNEKMEQMIADKKVLKIDSDEDADYIGGINKKEFHKFGGTNEKKFLSDEMTDFNSKYFFSDKEHRLRFINLVVKILAFYMEMLKKYLNLDDNNLNFIFKGGIIIRFFVKEMVRDFGSDIENYIYSIVDDYVKIGDFDFEIITNPDVVSFENINKINILSQIVLLHIRNYLLENKEFYFNFFNYSRKYQQKLLTSTLNELNEKCKSDDLPEENFYHGITIDYIEFDGSCVNSKEKIFQKKLTESDFQKINLYKNKEELTNNTFFGTCRTDFSIIKNVEDKSAETSDTKQVEGNAMYFISTKNLLKEYNIPEQLVDKITLKSKVSGNRLYSTYNPDVMFLGGDGYFRNFQLNRIKYNYTIYFRKNVNGKTLFLKDNIPGEILDLSHALTNDIRKQQKHVFPYLKNPYFDSFSFFNTDIDFMSYSFEGLIYDLKMIIFDENGHQPWKDVKYKKRIYRLLFLIIFYYFSDISNKENYVSYAQKQINIKKFMTLVVSNYSSDRDFSFGNKLLDKIKSDLRKTYTNALKSKNDYDYNQFQFTLLSVLKKIYIIFYLERRLNHQKELSFNSLNENFLLQ